MTDAKHQENQGGTKMDVSEIISDPRLSGIYELAKLQRETLARYCNPFMFGYPEHTAYDEGFKAATINVNLPEADQLAIIDCNFIKDAFEPLMYSDFSVFRQGCVALTFFGDKDDIVSLDMYMSDLYPENNRTLFKDENSEHSLYQLNFYFSDFVSTK